VDTTQALPDLAEAKRTADPARRGFLRGGMMVGATTALGGLGAASLAHADTGLKRSTLSHYHIPASDKTVHWGYFSKNLKPVVEVESGDFVTIETLTHHANDDFERMIKGDPGAESVYYWDKKRKGVDRRGAGPMDASLFGRGAGEGLGVTSARGLCRSRARCPATSSKCAFSM
jgi:hypothetical protein